MNTCCHVHAHVTREYFYPLLKMLLATFLLKYWRALSIAALLRENNKLRHTWVIDTKCGATAAVIEQALGLDTQADIDLAYALQALAHPNYDSFTFVAVHLKGSRRHGVLGHTFIICAHGDLTYVWNSYIRNDGFEGLTFEACEPQKPRKLAMVRGGLHLLRQVYAEVQVGKALNGTNHARYTAAVASFVGQFVPRNHMRVPILTRYTLAVSLRTSAQLIESLQGFVNVHVPISETPWLQVHRDGALLSTREYLAQFNVDYPVHLKSVRHALCAIRLLV